MFCASKLRIFLLTPSSAAIYFLPYWRFDEKSSFFGTQAKLGTRLSCAHSPCRPHSHRPINHPSAPDGNEGSPMTGLPSLSLLWDGP